jgi:hypothetical protein
MPLTRSRGRLSRLALCSAVAAGAGVAAARQTPPPPKVPMDLSLQVGHQALAGQVEGTCEHAAFLLNNVPVETWRARYDSQPERSVDVTLTRPKNGGDDTISLAITLFGASHRVSTARGAEPSGSGTVRFESDGKGGALVIDAKTEAGTVLTGTIKCSTFTPAGPAPRL